MGAKFGKGNISKKDQDTLKHLKYNSETNQIESDREIQTTLNSFFLGDQHKMSSGAENIFFTNLNSNINFFPAWSGLKDHRIPSNRGAGGVITPSIRKYADMQTLEPYGAAAASGSVAYNKAAALLGNHSVLGQTFIVMEAVAANDWLEYQAWYGTDETGIQAYEQKFTGQAYESGDTVDWWFTHPIEGLAGTPIVTCIKLRKGNEDGVANYLQVRPSAANAATHYSAVRLRVFEDAPIEAVVSPNKVLLSNSQGLTTASNVTNTELSTLSGATTPETTSVEDDDGVLVNNSGTLMQVTLSSILAYIKRKVGGSTTSTTAVMEYASVETGGNGYWNNKSITLGGMLFTWSQPASGGGNLTMTKSPATNLSQTSGGQTVSKFTGSTLTGMNSVNENMWQSTGTLSIAPSVSMTSSSYQTIEYDLFTRSAPANKTAHWNIKVFATGSGTLFMAGSYMGPQP